MLCLHYIENEWEFFLASEVTTLPSELPFRKHPTTHHYMLLTPLTKPKLPVVVISPDLFKEQTVLIPKEIETRLIIHSLSQA